MIKSKSGPALFDLLATEDSTSPARTPGTVRPPTGDLGSPRLVETRVADRPVVLGTRSEPSAAPQRRIDSGSKLDRPPFVELDDDRVRVSFSSITAGVTVFVVALGLILAFEVGRRRGVSTAFARGFEAGRASYVADVTSDIEAARNQPPATNVVRSLLDEPRSGVPGRKDSESQAATSVKSPVSRTGWITGHTYIVVQGFTAGREADAEEARVFLAASGVEAAIVPLDSGGTRLITTQGFNRNDPTQRTLADQLLERVRAIGVEYNRSGGGYKLEGYFATLKGDRW